jgi:hypothetical protein
MVAILGSWQQLFRVATVDVEDVMPTLTLLSSLSQSTQDGQVIAHCYIYVLVLVLTCSPLQNTTKLSKIEDEKQGSELLAALVALSQPAVQGEREGECQWQVEDERKEGEEVEKEICLPERIPEAGDEAVTSPYSAAPPAPDPAEGEEAPDEKETTQFEAMAIDRDTISASREQSKGERSEQRRDRNRDRLESIRESDRRDKSSREQVGRERERERERDRDRERDQRRRIAFDVTEMSYEEYCQRHYSLAIADYRKRKAAIAAASLDTRGAVAASGTSAALQQQQQAAAAAAAIGYGGVSTAMVAAAAPLPSGPPPTAVYAAYPL